MNYSRLFLALFFTLTSCHQALAYTNRIIQADRIEGSSVAVNYIKNAQAEKNTHGWAAYADAAASRPADGTGGSPTLALSRTTSSPLRNTGSFLITKDAADRQGEGVSYDFTIDSADQAKVLQIRFDYEIASGTYVGGSTGDSDLIAYIYDVTNAQLIEPSVIKIDGSVSGVKYSFRSEFQTASNSTSYRLILHQALSGTDAYTFKFDNVEVSQNISSRGPPVTDWKTLDGITGTFTNTTYTGRYRRVGDSAEIEILGTLTGTPANATLEITLPSWLQIDTSRIVSNAVLGTARLDDSGAAYHAYPVLSSGKIHLVPFRDSTNTNPSYTTMSAVTQALPFTWANTDTFSLTVTVPILGWSSSQTLSQDGGTRVVTATMRRGTNQTISSVNETLVELNQVLIDTHGTANTSSYRYVFPEPGYYNVTGALQLSEITAGDSYVVRVKKNGTVVGSGGFGHNSTGTAGTVLINPFVTAALAGEYLELYIDSGADASYTVVQNDTATFMTITKIQGPQQIAATETIAVRANNDSGQTLTDAFTGAMTNFTKIVDTHNALNATTGVFTAPANGLYLVSAAFRITVPASTNTRMTVDFYKNNAFTCGAVGVNAVPVQGTRLVGASHTCLIPMNAGDTLYFSPYQVSGGSRDITGAEYNNLSIMRIGL